MTPRPTPAATDPIAAALAGLPAATPVDLIALATLASTVPPPAVPRALPVLCQPPALWDGAAPDRFTYWHVEARGTYGWLWPDQAPGKYLPRHLDTATVRRIRAAYGGAAVELRTVERSHPVLPRRYGRMPDPTGRLAHPCPRPVYAPRITGCIATPDGALILATADGGAHLIPPTLPPALDTDRLDAPVVEVTSPVLTWDTPDDPDTVEGWHVAWRSTIRASDVTAADVVRWRTLATTAGDAATAAWLDAHAEELVRESSTVAPLPYNADPDRIDRGPGRFTSPWLDVTPAPVGADGIARPAARIPHPPREGVEDGRLPWRDVAGQWRAGRTASPVEVAPAVALDGRPAHPCPLGWHGPVPDVCPACHAVAPLAPADPVAPVVKVTRTVAARKSASRARQAAALPTSTEALAAAMRTANRSATRAARLWSAAPVEVRQAIATALALPADCTAADVLATARRITGKAATDVAAALAVSAASGTGVATGGTD